MPQIIIDINKDTLAALALGAMQDGITVNEYISTCVAELAKVVEDQVENPVEEFTGEVTEEPPTPQPIVEDTTGVTPAPEKAGGPGAPLYNKRDTKWTI